VTLPRTFLSGPTLALVTLALALGNFMEVLDTTIANVAVPHIAGDLGVSPTQATWVITSYAVANAISVLLSGWLAQRFGQVRVFVGAVLLLAAATLSIVGLRLQADHAPRVVGTSGKVAA